MLVYKQLGKLYLFIDKDYEIAEIYDGSFGNPSKFYIYERFNDAEGSGLKYATKILYCICMIIGSMIYIKIGFVSNLINGEWFSYTDRNDEPLAVLFSVVDRPFISLLYKDLTFTAIEFPHYIDEKIEIYTGSAPPLDEMYDISSIRLVHNNEYSHKICLEITSPTEYIVFNCQVGPGRGKTIYYKCWMNIVHRYSGLPKLTSYQYEDDKSYDDGLLICSRFGRVTGVIKYDPLCSTYLNNEGMLFVGDDDEVVTKDKIDNFHYSFSASMTYVISEDKLLCFEQVWHTILEEGALNIIFPVTSEYDLIIKPSMTIKRAIRRC